MYLIIEYIYRFIVGINNLKLALIHYRYIENNNIGIRYNKKLQVSTINIFLIATKLLTSLFFV